VKAILNETEMSAIMFAGPTRAAEVSHGHGNRLVPGANDLGAFSDGA
jgi:hypothetical protein